MLLIQSSLPSLWYYCCSAAPAYRHTNPGNQHDKQRQLYEKASNSVVLKDDAHPQHPA
jgi:hypothetical protein